MSQITQIKNRYFSYLIGTSFQGVNRLIVSSFENENDRKGYTRYYLPKVRVKNTTS